MNLKELARKAISALFLSMLCLVAFAQTATGLVKDKTGEPMIGVNVLVKGTTNGTITDFDGKFSIPDVPGNATLVVSYIGYLSKEVKAGKDLVIVLEEDNKTLDEVVVIGYGTVKRRDLTGSVASVSGDKLAANPVANVAQALQGQLPGVSVTSQDGRPGAGMSIRVRGGGSITQSNDPLFIVDGVQVDNIDDIPADNIESIDVLKDAASTAIYGARGANGVIMVTTKGGKDGKVTVKYNMYYQMKENPKLLETMDSYDYVYNTWSYATAYGSSYGDGVAKYFGLGSKYGNNLDYYKGVPAHNYINDLMQTANSWSHDVSLSGGNDKTKFYASLNYMDDEGIRIKSGFQRWSASFKLTQKINKALTADFDLRYTETEIEGAGFDRATSAYQYRPIDPEYVKGDPSFTAGFGQGDTAMQEISSPVNYLDHSQEIKNNYRIRAKSGLTWNIVKGLTAKTELSLSRHWNQTKTWNKKITDKDYSNAKLKKGDGYGVRWATTLNYEVQGLGDDHSVSFLVGNEVLSSKSNSSEMYGYGYPDAFEMDDAFGMINMTTSSLGQDYFKAEIGTPNRTLSWFGRANYSYKGKYLLTATFRADGSSKFAANNSWGYFPAAAAAWRISDENFMEDAREWLDNLKLRVSYGTSGSDNINASLWKETWKTEQITVDGEKITTYVPGDMKGNPDLKWETTISRNLGLDFGFFNNWIRGSVDYYWNTTKDILMKVPVDAASGYSYQFQNVGETSNKGIELALGFDIVRGKNFNLGMNLTYNFNKNNVDKLMEGVMADTNTGWGSSMRLPAYDYIIREGQPVGVIQGFKSAGYYTVDDFNYIDGKYKLKDGVPDIQGLLNIPSTINNAYAAEGQVAVPGAPKFEDVTGNGIIDDDDKVIIGKTMPKHTGGFSLSGNWKAIDFSANFTYQIGGDVYNANAMHSLMGNKDNNLGQNRLKFVSDTFKYYDVVNGDLSLITDPSALAALNMNTKYCTFYSEYGITTSQFIEDASYLRLNTLTVGYTVPKIWTKKVGIENARIYFTGTNLFCLDGYSGIDPDVNTDTDGSNGFPTPNYDWMSYPKARTYTFGVNLTF
ncbi:SusC/RagA family TonB-linked outer membrane protein [Phocaeicola sp.]